MKDRLFYVLIIVIINVCNPSTYASNKSILVDRILQMHSATVRSILQDADGFLWIGTTEGLYRTDGLRYRQLLETNVSVTCLFLDSRNKLWVGTRTGLFYLENEKFKLSDAKIPLTPNKEFHITSIVEDKRNNIWIGTLNGLFKINPSTYTITRSYINDTKNSHSISDDKIKSLLVTNNGQLWVGTSHGINKYNEKNDDFELIVFNTSIKDKTNTIVTMIEGQNSKLYVGTLGGCFIFENDGFKEIKIENKQIAPISTLYCDSKNNIWISTPKTVYTTNNKGASVKRIYSSNKYFNNIISIFEDKSGCMWFGTYKNGLFNLPFAYLPIHNISAFYNVKSKKIETLANIYSMHVDFENNLWIASDELIVKKNIYNETFIQYIYPYDIDPKRIRKFYEYSEKELFLLFENKLTLQLNSSIKYSTNKFVSDVVSKSNILYTNEKKQIIIKLSKNNTLIVQNYIQNKRDGYTFKTLKTISLPSIGRIWDNKFITKLIVDAYGNFWLATDGKGVLYISEKNQSDYKFITEHEGLANDQILSLIEDRNNNIWAVAAFGFNCISQKNQNVIFSNRTSDINPSAFLKNSATLDKKGNIYLGKENGVIYFNPNDFNDTKKDFQILLSTLYANGKEYIIDEELNNRIKINGTLNNTNEIIFTPGEITFTLEFACTNYNSPLSTRYRYKLNNYHHDWITSSGKNASATFSNLDAGKYILQIQTSNDGINWQETDKKITIVITPFFYQTLVFQIFIVLFILIVITTIIVVRFNNIRKRNIKLQELIDKKTEDLSTTNKALIESKKEIEERSKLLEERNLLLEEKNEQIQELTDAKSRFFANISHEFKTPLSLISAPAELLLKKDLSNENKQHIKIILENTSRLNKLVKQVLDVNKLESGKEKLDITRFNINNLFNALYAEFKIISQKTNIRFSMILPDDEVWVRADYVKIEAILINLLSNGFRYCSANDSISVKLDIFNENSIQFTVKDTGPGIPIAVREQIFDRFYMVARTNKQSHEGTGIGLSIVYDYVNLHSGNIEIDSNEENGTCFIVKLPIWDKNNEWSKEQLHPDIFITSPKNTIKEENENVKKILIVEDNTELLNYLAIIIGEEYNVNTATNGKEALELLDSFQPDIIISDMMMPEMDGKELCQIIKNDINRCDILFILLTAVSDENNIIESWNIGADEYISKPFKIDMLMARIKNMLDSFERLRKKYLQGSIDEIESSSYSPLDKVFLENVKKHVLENIENEEFGIIQLSFMMNMSQSTLLRKMKRLTNLSIVEFIRHIRLDYAADLLLNYNKNTTEACFMSGFSSMSYFTKVFKDRFNTTPKDYKRHFKSK